MLRSSTMARVRVVLAALLCVETAGCGATTKPNVSGGYFNRTTWCPKLGGLSAGRSRGGPAITEQRVEAVNSRYQLEIIRVCPGVVSVGVSDAAIIRGEQEGKRNLPPASKLHEPVIAVGVNSKKDLPHGRVFLYGVPLLFQVMPQQIQLYSSAASRLSRAASGTTIPRSVPKSEWTRPYARPTVGGSHTIFTLSFTVRDPLRKRSYVVETGQLQWRLVAGVSWAPCRAQSTAVQAVVRL